MNALQVFWLAVAWLSADVVFCLFWSSLPREDHPADLEV